MAAIAGLFLACAALALVSPLMPVALRLTGPWVHALVPAALALAALLLPRPTARGARLRPAAAAALAAGAALLVQPVLHLAVLAAAWFAPRPGLAPAVFPALGLPTAGWSLAAVLVLAPLAEEWFFRGRLLPWLAERLGERSALSLSSLAFAVAHGAPLQALIAIPFGLLLGWLWLRARSLYPCVLAHLIHNALLAVGSGSLLLAPGFAALLIGVGLWLLIFGLAAARAADLGQLNRRLACSLPLAPLLSLAVAPLWQLLHGSLWPAAAAALVALPQGVDPGVAARRIDDLHRRYGLDEPLLDGLADRLEDGPLDPPRLWLLAVCRPLPIALAAAEVEARLEMLATCPWPSARHGEAARALGHMQPPALARILANDPELWQRWLPQPAQRLEALALIQALAEEPRSRGELLRASVMGLGDDGALALWAGLRAAEVSPRDRVLMQRALSEPEAALLRLAARDPAAAAIWRIGAGPSTASEPPQAAAIEEVQP